MIFEQKILCSKLKYKLSFQKCHGYWGKRSRKWDIHVMSTMVITLCPLSSTWSGVCAAWNDQAAQLMALPSLRVQLLLVTQCRRRLSSNFKVGRCPTWELLQLGSFCWIKQKCQDLKLSLLKHNSVKEFVGWNGMWSKTVFGCQEKIRELFQKEEGNEAPQFLPLPYNSQDLHIELGCYKGDRNP